MPDTDWLESVTNDMDPACTLMHYSEVQHAQAVLIEAGLNTTTRYPCSGNCLMQTGFTGTMVVDRQLLFHCDELES